MNSREFSTSMLLKGMTKIPTPSRLRKSSKRTFPNSLRASSSRRMSQRFPSLSLLWRPKMFRANWLPPWAESTPTLRKALVSRWLRQMTTMTRKIHRTHSLLRLLPLKLPLPLNKVQPQLNLLPLLSLRSQSLNKPPALLLPLRAPLVLRPRLLSLLSPQRYQRTSQ